jgi:lipoprotein signal peptidase
MMGPLATGILIGCLAGLRWLLWLVAFLLAVLLIVHAIRGDAGANPLQTGLLVLFFGGLGWVSGFVSARILAAS